MSIPESEDWRLRAYWEAAGARELSASQDYDRAILTLSSATLALTATFLKDIAPNPPKEPLLLVASWTGLIVAIVLIIGSFLISQWVIRAEARNEGAPWMTKLTVAVNVVAGVGFVVGIVLFAIFALLNVWR